MKKKKEILIMALAMCPKFKFGVSYRSGFYDALLWVLGYDDMVDKKGVKKNE